MKFFLTWKNLFENFLTRNFIKKTSSMNFSEQIFPGKFIFQFFYFSPPTLLHLHTSFHHIFSLLTWQQKFKRLKTFFWLQPRQFFRTSWHLSAFQHSPFNIQSAVNSLKCNFMLISIYDTYYTSDHIYLLRGRVKAEEKKKTFFSGEMKILAGEI